MSPIVPVLEKNVFANIDKGQVGCNWKQGGLVASLIGLTGNMGSGKSLVGKMLTELDSRFVVFDCDTEAKKLIGEHWREVVCLLALSGELGSPSEKLRVVFRNSKQRKKLEGFLYSLLERRIRELQSQTTARYILVESAILHESGFDLVVGPVILVTCSADTRMRRLTENRLISLEVIAERLSWQWDEDSKRPLASCILNSDCSLPELERRVRILRNVIVGD